MTTNVATMANTTGTRQPFPGRAMVPGMYQAGKGPEARAR